MPDVISEYYSWLRGLVEDPALFHHQDVYRSLWNVKFTPFVDYDGNRAEDGIALRQRFTNETSIVLPYLGEWCNMLELLIALAIRLNEIDYIPTEPNRVSIWFWTLVDNLGIRDVPYEPAMDALHKLNARSYASDGYGGLFPLRKPQEDQRKVEIWYQMQAYLMENRF